MGEEASHKNVSTFHYFFWVKKIAQLALQQLNLGKQFNFNLVLPDSLANETPGESDSPDKHCFQSYASEPFALTPRLGLSGSNAFAFHFCFQFAFRVCDHMEQAISFPDLARNFRCVLWRIEVSK